MLVLTIAEGQTVLAEGEFELKYVGLNYSHFPEFELQVASDRELALVDGEGEVKTVAVAGEVTEIVGSFDGHLRIGGVKLVPAPRGLGKVRLGIEGPESVRYSRPAKHGGSLTRR